MKPESLFFFFLAPAALCALCVTIQQITIKEASSESYRLMSHFQVVKVGLKERCPTSQWGDSSTDTFPSPTLLRRVAHRRENRAIIHGMAAPRNSLASEAFEFTHFC